MGQVIELAQRRTSPPPSAQELETGLLASTKMFMDLFFRNNSDFCMKKNKKNYAAAIEAGRNAISAYQAALESIEHLADIQNFENHGGNDAA